MRVILTMGMIYAILKIQIRKEYTYFPRALASIKGIEIP